MGTNRRTRRPASTPEGRENQLISDAYDLSEKQLQSGTASAQVITHFLKAGSIRNRLECERLQQENLLMAAKVDAMSSTKRIEELYEDALKAMSVYTGQSSDDDEEFFDEDDYYD